MFTFGRRHADPGADLRIIVVAILFIAAANDSISLDARRAFLVRWKILVGMTERGMQVAMSHRMAGQEFTGWTNVGGPSPLLFLPGRIFGDIHAMLGRYPHRPRQWVTDESLSLRSSPSNIRFFNDLTNTLLVPSSEFRH